MKEKKAIKAMPDEWAEHNFYMSHHITARPGPIKLDEYQKAPLRWFMEEKHSIHCWGTLLGKDTIIDIIIDYLVATTDCRSTIQVCYPCQNTARRRAKKYLWPMLEKYLPDSSMLFNRQVNAMNINVVWSGCLNSLLSASTKYLFRSDIDRFPLLNDFIDHSTYKTKPFGDEARIFDVSVPTIKSGFTWKSFKKGCQYLFFVPCPHCGEFDHLEFENFIYPQEQKTSETEIEYFSRVKEETFYRCPMCSGIIDNNDKREMVRRGKWGKTNPFAKTCSSRLPIWYSPCVPFGEVVNYYLESKNNPERMRNFKNAYCALPI